eukprot:NODE_1370_length_887_cov_17.352632_g1324_i0.p1 GENE.NODE_1370_length_887_cov_17.352632_g1324_i0~~NODE_1370_length_887_cov_17.352632_g1324_i0.p1  ORF type:complete len:236 (-),score=54.45 NODE_1370_length_887_cov_17.352632_g1324_i0:68-775(-)
MLHLGRRLLTQPRLATTTPRVLFSTTRFNQNTAPADAEKKAEEVMQKVPSNSILKTTGVIAAGAGLSAFAVSKEILILHAETLVVVNFMAMTYFLYTQLREPVANYIDSEIDEVRNNLEASRIEKIKETEELASRISEMSVYEQYCNDVVGITTETIKNQAVLFDYNRQVKYQKAFQQKLEQVRVLEQRFRSEEQKALLQHLRSSTAEAAKDPKFQQKYFETCVDQLKEIAARQS